MPGTSTHLRCLESEAIHIIREAVAESERPVLVRRKHEDIGLRFVEVFVDTPLEVCEQRDPKGLYARARAGEITGMTGVDDPYEEPVAPDVRIEGSAVSVSDAAGLVLVTLS